MYVTTWGNGNPNETKNQIHSKELLIQIRKFVEAVLDYTGAPKINIIGHSMGVTIGRKVVKGVATVDGGDIGPSLISIVSIFVGLAGANWGLTACYMAPTYKTCGSKLGFYPGYMAGSFGISSFLSDINTSGGSEGDYVLSIFSTYDDLIGFGDIVWGKYTSAIPGQTD